MIRQIEVENFQSLRKMQVALGKFTVVTGRTGIGKSAFIRAVRLLAFNARGTQYVSRGQKTARVSMSGSDAEDTAWVVDIERGNGSKDSYHVIDGGLLADGALFTKLAGKVPEQVAGVLRLSEVNFAGQLDRPYLLDATGSEVARVLGKLTNVTLLYKAAQEANRRRLESGRQLKTRQDDLAALQDQVAQYVTLPGEKTAVETAERSLAAVRQAEQRLGRLDSLVQALALAAHARDRLSSVCLPEPPDLTRLEQLAARRTRLMQLAADVVNARYRADQLYRVSVDADEANHLADLELQAYTDQWDVCPTCGQPARKDAIHTQEGH